MLKRWVEVTGLRLATKQAVQRFHKVFDHTRKKSAPLWSAAPFSMLWDLRKWPELCVIDKSGCPVFRQMIIGMMRAR